MVAMPDPKKYDVEYNDMRNTKLMSTVGTDSGYMSFLINKRFDFDEEALNASGHIKISDLEFHKLVP